jgi:hypothetical protein
VVMVDFLTIHLVLESRPIRRSQVRAS